MIRIMERRAFLAASGTALAALSAGCSEIVSRDEQRDYAFGVYNASQESHSFRIRIGNDVSEAWFHEETLELDAETANEEISIDDTPSRIFIEIDSDEEREFPWPASTSELGNTAQKADIWYEPTLNQDVLIYGDR